MMTTDELRKAATELSRRSGYSTATILRWIRSLVAFGAGPADAVEIMERAIDQSSPMRAARVLMLDGLTWRDK
jgi:hypothetical protein